LEDAFSVALVGIAGLASLIGLAELSGSASTAAFTDRLGKRRAVTIGLVINIVGYSMMASAGGSIVLGVAGALVAFAGFEFLIVSSFPLASELVPEGRARYLAWMVVAIGLGRGLAGLGGPVLFARVGFGANAVTAIGLDVVALAVLRLTVTEPQRNPTLNRS
jgi:MFS family permease